MCEKCDHKKKKIMYFLRVVILAATILMASADDACEVIVTDVAALTLALDNATTCIGNK